MAIVDYATLVSNVGEDCCSFWNVQDLLLVRSKVPSEWIMVLLAETTVSEPTVIIDRLPWFAGNGKKVDSSVMLYSSILKAYESASRCFGMLYCKGSVSRQDGRYILKYSRAMPAVVSALGNDSRVYIVAEFLRTYLVPSILQYHCIQVRIAV